MNPDQHPVFCDCWFMPTQRTNMYIYTIIYHYTYIAIPLGPKYETAELSFFFFLRFIQIISMVESQFPAVCFQTISPSCLMVQSRFSCHQSVPASGIRKSCWPPHLVVDIRTCQQMQAVNFVDDLYIWMYRSDVG